MAFTPDPIPHSPLFYYPTSCLLRLGQQGYKVSFKEPNQVIKQAHLFNYLRWYNVTTYTKWLQTVMPFMPDMPFMPFYMISIEIIEGVKASV